MDLELQDKVVFVAGSSRGIGLAIARTFLREGSKVVITGRSAESLDDARKLLKTESKAERILVIQGDMTKGKEIQHALDETVSVFGEIDGAVANIGSGVARGGWELDLEDWQSVLDTNLLGSMALASAVLTPLANRGGGTLTFVSSIVANEAVNAPITYSAAKAAVQNAMKNFSRLVGVQGVRVNAVAPGNVLFPGGSWEQKLAERPEFFEQYIQAEVPLQRFGNPEEIADAVVFLASARASFITGACLVVDGGQTRSF
jgi:3-oxoacyl-[acyl-carrier protein] reductase